MILAMTMMDMFLMSTIGMVAAVAILAIVASWAIVKVFNADRS